MTPENPNRPDCNRQENERQYGFDPASQSRAIDPLRLGYGRVGHQKANSHCGRQEWNGHRPRHSSRVSRRGAGRATRAQRTVPALRAMRCNLKANHATADVKQGIAKRGHDNGRDWRGDQQRDGRYQAAHHGSRPRGLRRIDQEPAEGLQTKSDHVIQQQQRRKRLLWHGLRRENAENHRRATRIDHQMSRRVKTQDRTPRGTAARATVPRL